MVDTLLVYLNEDFEGGYTRFTELDLNHARPFFYRSITEVLVRTESGAEPGDLEGPAGTAFHWKNMVEGEDNPLTIGFFLCTHVCFLSCDK